MNRIFKVVFSKAKGVFVVGSEIIKSHGGKSKTVRKAAVAAALMAGAMGLSGNAMADTRTIDSNNTTVTYSAGSETTEDIVVESGVTGTSLVMKGATTDESGAVLTGKITDNGTKTSLNMVKKGSVWNVTGNSNISGQMTVQGATVQQSEGTTLSLTVGTLSVNTASAGTSNLVVNSFSTVGDGYAGNEISKTGVYISGGTANINANEIAVRATNAGVRSTATAGTVNLKGNAVSVAGGTDGIYIVNDNSSVSIGNLDQAAKVTVTGGTTYGVYTSGNSKVQIGTDTSKVGDTVITGNADGIWAQNGAEIDIFSSGKVTVAGSKDAEGQVTGASHAGIVNIKGKVAIQANEVEVTSAGDEAIVVQNGTESAKDSADYPDNPASVSISADTITVNNENGNGLSAYSNGQMDISGGLTVNAKNAIDVRGYSTTNINTDGTHTTVLNGDIVFETPGSASGSGEIIDAYVNVNLTGEGSSWTGQSYQQKGSDQTSALTSDVTGFNLTIADGAAWNVTGDSFVNNLNMSNGGVVNGAWDKSADEGAGANTGTANTVDIGTLTVNGDANNVLNKGTYNATNAISTGSTGTLQVGGATEDDAATLTVKEGNGELNKLVVNAGSKADITGSTTTDEETETTTLNYAIDHIDNAGTTTLTSVKSENQTNTDGYGASIYTGSGSNLTVADSTFSGNSAVWGGAIESDADTLDISGTTFTNNTGTRGGGAVDINTGTNTITGSTFTKNTATDYYGGAIMQWEGTTTISGSTFTGNTADNANYGYGGAVAASGGSLTITGSEFSGNSAGFEGGAVFVNPGVDATITGGSFSKNNAGVYGGAIANNSDNMTISGVAFTENTSTTDNGGAVMNNGTMTIQSNGETKTTFGSNSAEAGGALSNFDNLTVTGAEFTGNSASGDTEDGGGAVYLGASSNTSINGATFTGNESKTAGGGAIDMRKFTTGNNEAAKLDISNSEFSGNIANTDGGAIYNTFYGSNTEGKTDGVVISSTKFENNIATNGNGGAIYNAGTVEGDVVESGQAGKIYLDGVTMTGNEAGGYGGAVYNAEGGEIVLSGTNTFSDNKDTDGDNDNDIYNEGTMTVAGGTTTLNSGLVNAGTTNITGGNVGEGGVPTGTSLTIGDLQENNNLLIDSGTVTLSKVSATDTGTIRVGNDYNPTVDEQTGAAEEKGTEVETASLDTIDSALNIASGIDLTSVTVNKDGKFNVTAPASTEEGEDTTSEVGKITNAGIVDVADDATLTTTIDGADGTINNDGTLNLTGDSSLGDVTNNGDLDVAATTSTAKNITGTDSTATVTVDKDGTLTITDGKDPDDDGFGYEGTIKNDGTVNISATTEGDDDVYSIAKMENNGTLNVGTDKNENGILTIDNLTSKGEDSQLTVNSGILSIGDNSALNDDNTVKDGATLDMSGDGVTAGKVTVDAGGTLSVTDGDATVGEIANSGTILVSGEEEDSEGQQSTFTSPDLNATIHGENGKVVISDDGTLTLTGDSELGTVANGTEQVENEEKPGGWLDIGGNTVTATKITSIDTAASEADYDEQGENANTGTAVTVIDGGKLLVKESSSLGNVTVGENGTSFDLNTISANDDGVKLDMATLMNGGETKITTSSGAAGQVVIGENSNVQGESGGTGSLKLDLDSTAANQLSGSNTKQTAQSGANVITIADQSDKNSGDGYAVHIAEGDINGEITAMTDKYGNIIQASEKMNTAAAGLQRILSSDYLLFRSQMNDVNRRMGDLRTMPKADGLWARAYTGQSKYKDLQLEYNTLQLGIDHRIGNFYGGLTASYTDADAKFHHGDSDAKNYNFGIYGGWQGDDGQYVDVILKRHKQEQDYTVKGSNAQKGSYDRAGTSVSVEYGWRLGLGEAGYYVEPQAEFMYGHLNSTGFKTDRGIKVDSDSIESAIGRLGVQAGWADPDGKGSLYAKASVMHEWEAENTFKTSKGNQSRKYTEDMDGTWGEFAVGGTANLNKNVSIYGEAQADVGNPVHTDFQFSAGVRFNFE